MDSHTFRSRLVLLLQKSRKAVRLYSTMEKDVNAEQWRTVTTDLLKELTAALENPNTKRLSQDIFALRDRFYSDWRMAESELHLSQKELISSAELGDFTKAMKVASKLISVKSYVQASQAAYHELHEILTKSKIAEPSVVHADIGADINNEAPPIELVNEFKIAANSKVREYKTPAKVIPLKKRSVI